MPEEPEKGGANGYKAHYAAIILELSALYLKH